MTAEPTSPILAALYHGQLDEARRLAVETTTPLSIHEAAALGDLPALEASLGADAASVNAWSSDGFQPLALACFFGQPAAAERLLGAGAEVNTAARHPFRVMPLHAAVAGPTPELAWLLVSHGADVNARQQGEVSPLHAAAHRGDQALVELLLAAGADPATRDAEGRSAADHARAAGFAELATTLDSGTTDPPRT
jgi:ankyrin repeat protein